MRTNLIIIGVILLAIGGILFYLPYQSASAGTGMMSRFVWIAVPPALSLGLAAIGAVLLVLGLSVPDQKLVEVVHTSRPSEEVHTKTVEKDDGMVTHKVTREHRIHQ